MKIYADILFSINFFMDLFIVYVSGTLLRCKTELKKIFISSLLCSLICCVAPIFFFNNLIVNIMLTALMPLFFVKAVFNPPNFKTLINYGIVLFFVSVFTAGIFTWIYDYSNILYYSSEYFSLTAGVFIICFGVVSTIFMFWTKKIRRITSENSTYVKAVIEFEQRSTEVNLFIDSGCMLKKSGERTIIIVEFYEVMEILEDELACEIMLSSGTEEIIVAAEKLGRKECFENIDFSTASGNGDMACLKCDGRLYYGNKEKQIPLLVGIYMGRLFNDNECNGLIGASELKNIM